MSDDRLHEENENPTHDEKTLSRRQLMKSGALAGAVLAGGALAGGAGAQTSQNRTAPAQTLTGQVAYITGAARGIGRAIAVGLAQRGADVVALDILAPIPTYRAPGATQADMEETVRLVRAAGQRIIPIRGDVRSLSQQRAAVERALREFGRLDMLVANAGIGAEARVGDMTERQWQDVIDINLTGYFKSIHAVLPHMTRQKRGKIVAISSVAGRFGAAGGANYGAAKWGVEGLVKAVAREYGPDNIRANAICPTFINTPQITNDRYLREVAFPDNPNPTPADVDRQARGLHALPVGMLQPVEIANAAAFLMSDDARFITGEILDVAAGWNATWMA